MKIDVLKDAQRRIKVAAKALWHIGDASNLRGAVGFVGHVTIKHRDMALLNNANTCDQSQHCRLTDSVRTDHSNHTTGGDLNSNIVERNRFPIAMENVLYLGYDAIRHSGSFTTRSSGHGTLESVRTKPRPRTPVLTSVWYLPSTFGSTWSLTRKISFSRSSVVSTLFGVNWASVATKLTVPGTTYCGNGSRIMRASSPIASFPACAAGR